MSLWTHGSVMVSSFVATSLGILLALSMSTVSWSDGAGGVGWAVFGAVVAVASLRSRWPVAFPAYVALYSAAVLGSAALGSSWAAVTWLPAQLAAVALGRWSNSFALALTATLLVSDAPTIVVLSQVFGAEGTSGSVQYFLGFVGVVSVPLWFRVAVSADHRPWSGVLKAAAVIVASLGVWAVLASGSRAALLGLCAVLLAGLVGPLLSTAWRRVTWRPALLTAVVVGLLVPGIDYALGAAFGAGRSTALPETAGGIDVTTTEIQSPGGTLGGVRIPLWRQSVAATVTRPFGHGPGSYTHVNHAYQNDPLLWSGSPHSVWALAAVETGVPGLAALLVLVLGGLYVAARRGSPAMPALLGATAVMSLDVFSSMPVQSLVWWAVIGAAWGPSGSAKGRLARLSSVSVIAVVLAFGVYMSLRLSAPCGEGCDPIVQYGGHPRLAGLPSQVIGSDPDDPRWAVWKERYPLAFWLAYAETMARVERDPTALIDLLRAYPFQSAQTFVDVADAFGESPMAADVASCGLVRFFDGRPIYRDWREQGTVLDDQRLALEERAGTTVGDEAACVRAGIPEVAIGLQ